MKNRIKKIFSTFMIVGIMSVSAVPVFAAQVGGGTWDYGTKIVGVNKKQVYSNYYHAKKTHKSSVSIGTTFVSSGWVSKGKTSYASATGSWKAETHAYYNYK